MTGSTETERRDYFSYLLEELFYEAACGEARGQTWLWVVNEPHEMTVRKSEDGDDDGPRLELRGTHLS